MSDNTRARRHPVRRAPRAPPLRVVRVRVRQRLLGRVFSRRLLGDDVVSAEDEQLHGARRGDDILGGFGPPARGSEERGAKRGGERPRRLRRLRATTRRSVGIADESSTESPLRRRRRIGERDARRERERHAKGTSRRRVEAFEERSKGDDGAGRSTGKRHERVGRFAAVKIFDLGVVLVADGRGGEDGVVEAVGEEWLGEGL